MPIVDTQHVDRVIEKYYDGSLMAYQYAQVVDRCQQVAGKALGYPWFKDDQKNFPGSNESHGVCIGVHVDETIIEELAREYLEAKRSLANREIECARLKRERDVARSAARGFGLLLDYQDVYVDALLDGDMA